MTSLIEHNLITAAFSSKGKVRAVNEDRASINGRKVKEEQCEKLSLGAGNHLLLVADGMGGHARGDLASALAIQVIYGHIQELKNPTACIDVLREANRKIYDAMREDPTRQGMGTTIVGAAITQKSIIWFNVGDSRAYLCRDQKLRQLSIDHIPKSGTEPPARRSHAITQSLGGSYHHLDIWPATGNVTRLPGDRLLLCSDGLTDLVSDDEICSWLCMEPFDLSVARKLVDLVLTRGAPDNVTVIVAAL